MTFPNDLVRQNDMVYAKSQLLLSLLRSINLTFFQNQRNSLFSQKNGEVKIFRKRLQETANLQETASQLMTTPFLMAKVKMQTKDDKMMISERCFRAVDVTLTKDLVRQNDMVYAKIQLLLSLLRSINLTFSKINGTAFSVKKWRSEDIQKKAAPIHKKQPIITLLN